MNKIVWYIVAAIVGITLLLFTCTFQVRFNEQSIVTTFGRAGDGSLVTEPGLHFKWPYPVQSVQTYDVRNQVLQARIESVLTADQQLVDVQVFLVWHIDNPLDFFEQLESVEVATSRLEDRLRSAFGVFSEFSFSELIADDNMLASVEKGMLDKLALSTEDIAGLETYGIRPIAVGISRFILPENTSTAVFNRMKQTRLRMAANARASGEAEASKIRAEAKANADKIRSFAGRLAANIRAQGDREAAEMFAQLNEEPELAIYLRKLRAIESMINRNTTVILPYSPPFDLLATSPLLGSVMSGESTASLSSDAGDGQ